MRKALCTLFFMVLLAIDLEAAIPDMKFRRLDSQDGLSNSQVNCIFRDSRGNVWLGTAYGLNRYDGYRIKTFYSNKRDTTSMRDNYTDEIMEAYDGKLWLKQGMNYCVYDPVTESFERNIGTVLSKFGIPNGVERLYIDCKQRFWVKVYEDGIYGESDVYPTFTGDNQSSRVWSFTWTGEAELINANSLDAPQTGDSDDGNADYPSRAECLADESLWNTEPDTKVYAIFREVGAELPKFDPEFEGHKTTGVLAPKAATASNGVVYNAAGQQVGKAAKGLLIQNGKKVVIK